MYYMFYKIINLEIITECDYKLILNWEELLSLEKNYF